MLIKTSIHSVIRPLDTGHMRVGSHTAEKLVDELSVLLAAMYGLYQECLYYRTVVQTETPTHMAAVFEHECDKIHAATCDIEHRLTVVDATQDVAAKPLLPAFPADRSAVASIDVMIRNVAKGHERCSRLALTALETAEMLDDQKTVSTVLHAMLMHDKAAWVMRTFKL